jgi:hypothetical protein
MGAGSRTGVVEAPPQPLSWSASAERRRDDFSSAYTPAPGAGNPFAVYDAELDDDGADGSAWEAEAVGARAEARPWQPRFYQAYFDVTVDDVAVRLLRSVLPYKPLLGWADCDEEDNGGTCVPDLYGPVWLTTTAVLALSVGASVANFLSNVFRGVETIDATKSLAGVDFARLWKACTILYFYVFVFPLILTAFQFMFLRRSLNESSVSTHPIIGAIMVYGYSLTPLIIAAAIATIPIRLVQLTAMGVAFGLGVIVIFLNLNLVGRDVGTEHRSLTIFVRFIAACTHLGIGVVLTSAWYF